MDVGEHHLLPYSVVRELLHKKTVVLEWFTLFTFFFDLSIAGENVIWSYVFQTINQSKHVLAGITENNNFRSNHAQKYVDLTGFFCFIMTISSSFPVIHCDCGYENEWCLFGAIVWFFLQISYCLSTVL